MKRWPRVHTHFYAYFLHLFCAWAHAQSPCGQFGRFPCLLLFVLEQILSWLANLHHCNTAAITNMKQTDAVIMKTFCSMSVEEWYTFSLLMAKHLNMERLIYRVRLQIKMLCFSWVFLQVMDRSCFCAVREHILFEELWVRNLCTVFVHQTKLFLLHTCWLIFFLSDIKKEIKSLHYPFQITQNHIWDLSRRLAQVEKCFRKDN